jgi:lysosomal acid lipase/cholesteryl ester hydrolase
MRESDKVIEKPSSRNKKGIVLDNVDEFPKNEQTGQRPVVLLYHGLTLTSEVWISNIEEERNLALYLVDRGYDVWMGNARGNKYSQSHLTRNPKNDDFWGFSINEFAIFDLPGTVDVGKEIKREREREREDKI